jgi:hypothetical protein
LVNGGGWSKTHGNFIEHHSNIVLVADGFADGLVSALVECFTYVGVMNE